MPIYEYRFGHCQRYNTHRRISSMVVGKTARSAQGKYPSSSGLPPLDYYSDPPIIGRRVEESFARYGMGMPGSVRRAIEAAREGDLPKGLDA